MYLHSIFLPFFLALLPPSFSATTISPADKPALQTITLHHLSSSHSAKTLATLAFFPSDPSLSKVQSFTPPHNSTYLTRIAIPVSPSSSSKNNDYRTTLTSTSSFHAPYTGRFRILITQEGEVLGASWHASPSSSNKPTLREGQGDFDIVLVEKGPQITGLEPEKKIGADGKADGEVEEKTFLQK